MMDKEEKRREKATMKGLYCINERIKEQKEKVAKLRIELEKLEKVKQKKR